MSERPAPLGPGAVVGILGGGQLGRMLAMAAARLGFRAHIYDPARGGPAMQVAPEATVAPFDDDAALARFATACDVATYEFENVPLAAADAVAAHCPLRPGREALARAQDRLEEKRFLRGLGLATAPFHAIDGPADLAAALADLRGPGILKTRRLGYDGKGQVRVAPGDDSARAWEAVGGAPSILEGFVPFEREISVIAARGLHGHIAAYDPGENVHETGILRTTTVPARIGAATARAAQEAAGRILGALDYAGVIGVEFFVTPEGLVVNEFAPRVHNSGHWTQDGATACQFEQHIRAIAGWPLADPARHSDVVMTNLIGADVADLQALAAGGGAIHLYGKAEARPGRKMGHVNRVTARTP